MRLALAGATYVPRSSAAGSATCINLYPEAIENPQERAKGLATLYGTPGRHLFKDLTTIDAAATPIRGLLSGRGRLFVGAGTKYMELNSSGALVGSVRTITNPTNDPVQFFYNGSDLLIISGTLAYIDVGAGPVLVAFETATLTGTCTPFNAGAYFFVDWDSGDGFTPDIATITIGGTPYTVAQFISGSIDPAQPGRLRLTASATAAGAGAAFSAAPVVNAQSGAFLDSYFIISRTNSRQFNVSGINDGTTWSALDFGVKESYTDYIRRVIAVNEQLLIFGTETFEFWQNTGNPTGVPFSRINGATGNVGTISTWSPVVCGDGKVRFLGTNSDGQIIAYVMDGFTPKRISTHAEESAWNDGNPPTNAYSYSYTEEGHQFWVFHIGTQCWGYDITSNAWHTRAAWSGSAFTTYPTYFHTFIAEFSPGKHITGGLADGKLYESSINFYDDAGSDIRAQRALPYNYVSGRRQFFGRMDLNVPAGTVITREYSDDKGITWSTPGSPIVRASSGAFWPKASASYERIWRFTITGQAKIALVSLDCEITEGAN